MFDFAWSELAVIAVVALVVIGPKDLPRVMRMVGQWVSRARSIAREFQGSLDQMVREAELDDIKRNFDKVSNFNVENEIHQTIDPHGDLQRSLNEPVLSNPLIDLPNSADAEAVTQEKSLDALPPAVEPSPEADTPAPAPAPQTEHR
jgi:sec-independent protein translocase protein TatB